jgi:uncharacterized protein YdeI (YjbR/CyaY-like superfamily)
MSNASPELPVRAFRTAVAWEAWLAKNHARADGIWVRFYKKGSSTPTVTYSDALDVALCYGWIDSQVKTYDQQSYIQKFTPRRARSPWSKINRDRVARLDATGRMQPPGIAEVERAKADGRWEAAADPPSQTTVPDDFLAALRKNRKAHAFFATLNRRNTHYIAYRLRDAKRADTRQKRTREMIEMLARGEAPAP